MWPSGAGSSAFDAPYLVIQVVLALVALVLLIGGRSLGAFGGPVLVAALLCYVGTPAWWYLAYPPANGIEGAGRILFLVPTLGINGVLLAIAVWRHLKR